MAIDSTSVYWTTCGDPTGGLVRKAPKSGGAVTTLASGDRLSGVTVDETSVYWIAGTPDASSGAVMKAPLDGGAATTLAVRAGAPAHIAVDDTSVYWTELLTGAVMKVPLTGGTPIVVATTRAPWAIAVDATDVYWLSRADGVMKAPKTGGAATRLCVPGPTLPTAGIAVDRTNVYWATQFPPGLSAVSIHGGTPSGVYAETPATTPGALAIDGTSLYWADMSNAVHAGPLAGGNAVTLATGQAEVVAIAVDATSAYLLVNGNANPGQGSVVRLTPK